jgi:Sulfotransferase family
MKPALAHPVAIGGIGGSGTRVIAALLDMTGYYLGDDLNDFKDNQWFTLIFKRRSILIESDVDFRALALLFCARMSGRTAISEQEQARIYSLTEKDRYQHSRDWLIHRALSFCSGVTSKRPDQPWCWKEPNTHVVVDRIFGLVPELRYIHIVRHPLDMAVSGNQAQLYNWGPIFLSQDVTIEPRSSLSYWCAAHRRVVDFMRTWPERTMMIDFDALCAKPEPYCALIGKLLGTSLPDEAVERFRDYLHRPGSSGRFRSKVDPKQFDPADLAYVAEIGYPL